MYVMNLKGTSEFQSRILVILYMYCMYTFIMKPVIGRPVFAHKHTLIVLNFVTFE